MSQEDSSTSSQQESLSQTNTRPIEDMQRYPAAKICETMNATPFFPVTEKVTFKPMLPAPERGAGPLPPSVARLVSLVSLGAMFLLPLSGCGSGESNVPCPVPTPNPAGTLAPDGTPTASCSTSGGTHYVWIHSRGGWVESEDGVHPKPNASGVGVSEEEHSSTSSSGAGEGEHSGVGDGHAGAGHGGGGGG